MWKIRELEKQTKDAYETKPSRPASDEARWDHSGYKELYPEEFETSRTRMRCDGFESDVHRQLKAKSLARAALNTEEEERQVRSLNKRFYECEASIPDRWGHSGYKELYPEEFDTDSDEKPRAGQTVNGKKASHLGRRTEQESRKRKRSKKSHKKKQKKRSHKKVKKRKKEETESSSDSESSDESPVRAKKMKRKKKTRKKTSRKPPSSSGQESDSSNSSSLTETSSVESAAEEDKNIKRTKRQKKKRHRTKVKKDFETQEKKSKRKNWKVANDERSDSSDED
ncbi:uncharacterized protein NKAPD1 isoform X2 [Ambystoma mexicanum]